MSHQLEIRENGTAAFLSVREIPWHSLGIVADDSVTSIEDATLIAQMRYQFGLKPVYVYVPGAQPEAFIPVYGDKQAVVRTNIDTGEIKAYGGSLSGRYQIHSLEEAWRWINELLPHGCKLETIGNLKGGSVAFICVKLPMSALAGTPDQVDMYLTVSTSYDGSSATNGIISSVRVVCANTLAWAESSKKASVKVRHNTVLAATDKVKAVLGLAEERVAQVEQLKTNLSYTVDLDTFKVLAEELFPIEPVLLKTPVNLLSTGQKRQVTTAIKARNTVGSLWKYSPFKADTGTAWDLYQAVVEYADHFAPVKGADASLRRAEKQLTQENSELKLKALEVMGVSA